jgi:UrcA family protein
MKRTLLALAATLALSVPAMAQTTVTVQAPAQVTDPATVEAFRNEVARAIHSVCRKESGPLLGINIYALRRCVADTSREVAKNDTTGVLSAELMRDRVLTLASK